MQMTVVQISRLVELAIATKPDALGCDGCLELMDQFAQADLDGIDIPEALDVVRTHIEQCKCCKDEYQALMSALREISDAL